MTEQRVGPSQLTGDAARVRVEQELVGIEAIAVLRLVRPVGAIPVQEAELRVRQISVPHLIGKFRERVGRDLPLALRVEYTKINALRMRGEHREVRAESVPS